mmetsp:Transcript_22030/g.30993  ORF Transcript_22030/g.30993 Transcript_22030/m.30993 type:complete len:269 (+) Transcript_22030:227-1033(+)
MLVRHPVQVILHASQRLLQAEVFGLQRLAILLELAQREAELPVLQTKFSAFGQVLQLLRPLSLLHQPVPCGIGTMPARCHCHGRLPSAQKNLCPLLPQQGLLLRSLQRRRCFRNLKLEGRKGSLLGLMRLRLSLAFAFHLLLASQALRVGLLKFEQLFLGILLLLRADSQLLAVTIKCCLQCGLHGQEALNLDGLVLELLHCIIPLLLRGNCHLVQLGPQASDFSFMLGLQLGAQLLGFGGSFLELLQLPLLHGGLPAQIQQLVLLRL